MSPGPQAVASAESARFDAYAHRYDAELNRGLAVSGEDKEYFARGRIAFLGERLRRLGVRPHSLLEFGCGNGFSAPLFLELLGVDSVVGIDVSAEMLQIAAERYGSERVRFRLAREYEATQSEEIVFCNGVFHHVPPADRAEVLDRIRQMLVPGGIFAFWENNPWNPGTRYVMSRVAFDRDAVTIGPRDAQRFLRSAGFEVLSADSLFFFPRVLKVLRPMERFLCRTLLGAQYLVLCRKIC